MDMTQRRIFKAVKSRMSDLTHSSHCAFRTASRDFGASCGHVLMGNNHIPLPCIDLLLCNQPAHCGFIILYGIVVKNMRDCRRELSSLR